MYALYLDVVHPISQAAPKATRVTSLISLHLPHQPPSGENPMPRSNRKQWKNTQTKQELLKSDLEVPISVTPLGAL